MWGGGEARGLVCAGRRAGWQSNENAWNAACACAASFMFVLVIRCDFGPYVQKATDHYLQLAKHSTPHTMPHHSAPCPAIAHPVCSSVEDCRSWHRVNGSMQKKRP